VFFLSNQNQIKVCFGSCSVAPHQILM